MKKKSTFGIFIVTILIIGISIFSYLTYLKPIYNNNISQTKIIDTAKDEVISFRKHLDQNTIFGIEIEIDGEMTSNFDLGISNGEQIVHSATIKHGKVSFIYKNDWYADSCFLYFQPRNSKNGKLEVNCRFLSID